MKRIFLILFVSVVTITMYGQDIDKIFSSFSKVAKADNVHIGKFAMSFVKFGAIGNNDADFVRKINSLQVLDLSDCNMDIKRKFADQISKCNMNGYEMLMRVKDDEDDVLIMAKSKKEKIKEFIIIEKGDPAIIRMKGNFSMSDLSDIAKKYE